MGDATVARQKGKEQRKRLRRNRRGDGDLKTRNNWKHLMGGVQRWRATRARNNDSGHGMSIGGGDWNARNNRMRPR